MPRVNTARPHRMPAGTTALVRRVGRRNTFTERSAQPTIKGMKITSLNKWSAQCAMRSYTTTSATASPVPLSGRPDKNPRPGSGAIRYTSQTTSG